MRCARPPGSRSTASYFYPDGRRAGVRPGTLGARAVVDVEEDEAGHVWHRVAGRARPRRTSPPTIDAGRRHGLSPAAHGQHVLSPAFERVLAAYTVSSRPRRVRGHDRPRSRRADVGRRRARRGGRERGRVGRPRRAQVVVAPEELALYPLRKPPKVDGPVRLIVVPGLGLLAVRRHARDAHRRDRPHQGAALGALEGRRARRVRVRRARARRLPGPRERDGRGGFARSTRRDAT